MFFPESLPGRMAHLQGGNHHCYFRFCRRVSQIVKMGKFGCGSAALGWGRDTLRSYFRLRRRVSQIVKMGKFGCGSAALRETIISPYQWSDMSLRSIDLPVSWVATQTIYSRRERTQSHGANELKVRARTNSKSGRERTQSRRANELKVAARTNSK